MKLIQIIFFVTLSLCLGVSTFAQGKYRHLKKWANEYPLDYTAKPTIDFFLKFVNPS